jgi:hypothetical protein
MSNPYDPNAVPPSQDSGGYNPAPYGQPYPPVAPEHPQGTTVLVLGIVGIFFSICAPFAWYLGNKALEEIRASGVRYANEQNIVIGRILGIVFTILTIVALVLTVIFLIIAVVAAGELS